MKWYALHTYSGYEGKTKTRLEEIKEKLTEKIGEILIPTENVIQVVKGKKQVRTKKMLPGYVFVEMANDKMVWQEIRNLPNVTNFLGNDNIPRPMSSAEIENLKGHITAEAKPKMTAAFNKGENVRVIEGPFINFSGIVDAVFPEKGKVKVMVSILGRQTPVELEFQQVEKL
jgi:transcriptional antiterminator NusG